MTCKDCLHYQVCVFVADMSDEEREAENVENDCSQFFKDRSKWVEQKRGRWIPIIDEPCQVLKMPMLVGYRCSVCGREEQEEEPFCNCGALMTEGSEGDG